MWIHPGMRPGGSCPTPTWTAAMSVTLELAAPHSRIRPTAHERGPPEEDGGASHPAFLTEGEGVCSRLRI